MSRATLNKISTIESEAWCSTNTKGSGLTINSIFIYFENIYFDENIGKENVFYQNSVRISNSIRNIMENLK